MRPCPFLQVKQLRGHSRDTTLVPHPRRVRFSLEANTLEEMPAYSELTRRLGFEYNGMVLHEYYFENLTKGGARNPDQGSAFVTAAEDSFGTYDMWKLHFSSVGKMRGVGWAICYVNPRSGRLSNHWISLHENGNIAGFIRALVMDVWEHVYLLDYKPAKRASYIEAFFTNID